MGLETNSFLNTLRYSTWKKTYHLLLRAGFIHLYVPIFRTESGIQWVLNKYWLYERENINTVLHFTWTDFLTDFYF